MINSIVLVSVGLWLLEKLGDAVVNKILEKVLSDNNLKHLSNYLKLQILVLYLKWLLQKEKPGE